MNSLFQMLLDEDKNLNNLHWSVIAVLAMCCCEAGCTWFLKGNDIDTAVEVLPFKELAVDKDEVNIIRGAKPSMPSGTIHVLREPHTVFP